MKKYVITSAAPFCHQEILLAPSDGDAITQYLKMYACRRKSVQIVSKSEF